jgi:hypothetical protein
MTPQEIARFNAKRIQRDGDACWDWAGSLNPGSGYPQLRVGRGKTRTMAQGHKLAFELAYGPVPAGLHVLHSCGNRRCTRPDHLYAGDRRQNMADMKVHGGSNRAVLTPRDVLDILALKGTGAKLAAISERFGVSNQSVCNVLAGRTYASLTGISPRARA